MDKAFYLSMCLIVGYCCLAGCDSSDARLAAFAEKSVEQQAEQNAAQAKQNEHLHDERSSLNRQQDDLEADRREIAGQRVREPLVANALQAVGLILACLAPLLICAYALKQAGSAPPEQELGMVLVEELTSDNPQLLPPSRPLLSTVAECPFESSETPPLVRNLEVPHGQ